MARGIFGRSKDRAAEAPREVKASAAGRIAAMGVMGRVAWSPRDAASLTRAGFTGNPIGFRAVKLIAEAAAALPLACQDCERRYEVHPVLDLLRRPNPAQGRAELLEALYGQLLLTGDGYLEAVGDVGLPVELHVLRSDRMSVVLDREGWPSGFEYAVAGRKVRFEPDAVCHVRGFHPQDDHHGLSPMHAAAAAVDVHNAASRWSKALLDNAARPSGAIVHRAEGGALMTQEQFERLQAELEAHHQGARNAGRPMLLEGGLDWKPMGFSPSDMEFREVKARGRAGDRDGVRGASHAARDPRGRDLRQLRGGQPGVLPAHRAALGAADGGAGVGVFGGPRGRGDRAQGRPRRGAGALRRAGGSVAAGGLGLVPVGRGEAVASRASADLRVKTGCRGVDL